MDIINIAAPKGGQGTSTIAAGIAIGFAQKGHKVLLVDANDTGDHNAIVGVSPHFDGTIIVNDNLTIATYEEALKMRYSDEIDTIVYEWGTSQILQPGRTYVVTEACYLSARRFTSRPFDCDGMILIEESTRALQPQDMQAAFGVKIVGIVKRDPAVARAVDAGLFAMRTPKALTEGLDNLITHSVPV